MSRACGSPSGVRANAASAKQDVVRLCTIFSGTDQAGKAVLDNA